MASFEELYNEQTKDLEYFKIQYKVTDNFLDFFVTKNGRYPNEEECKEYYARLEKRRIAKENRKNGYNR